MGHQKDLARTKDLVRTKEKPGAAKGRKSGRFAFRQSPKGGGAYINPFRLQQSLPGKISAKPLKIATTNSHSSGRPNEPDERAC
jgi:hypothetical protein